MVIRPEAIVQVTPAAKPYAVELVRQMTDIGLTTPLLASHFLAQIHVESGGFTTVVENLNYAADSLIKMFGRHRISEADAWKFGRIDDKVRKRTGSKAPDQEAHQNALANILYGGEFGRKQLGNVASGDGWRFRGRGLKQLTGRDNYRRFSLHWLGTDELVLKPDRVAEPDGAVASAIWFWQDKNLTNLVLQGASVAAVTKKVNGGQMGLEAREKWTKEYFDALN